MSAAPSFKLPHDLHHGNVLNGVTWTGFGISAVFVAARVFTRVHILKSPGWDDFWLIFSLILNLTTAAANSVLIHYGLGRHVTHLTVDQLSHVLYYSAIFQPMGIAAFTFPKLAVMLLIVKVMGPRKEGRWFLYFIMTVLLATNLSFIILLYVRCSPANYLGRPRKVPGCFSSDALLNLARFVGAWGAFTDLSLALFPITIFWKLQMKRSKKIQITTLMGMGIFASVCAIVRTSTQDTQMGEDGPWKIFLFWIWSMIEADTIIVCASLPVIPRLLTWLKNGRVGQTHTTSKTRANGSRKSFVPKCMNLCSGFSYRGKITFVQPKTYQMDVSSDAAEKGQAQHIEYTNATVQSTSLGNMVESRESLVTESHTSVE